MYYGYDPNGNLIEESVIPVGHFRAGQAANVTVNLTRPDNI